MAALILGLGDAIMNHRIYVGTIGEGLWRSVDGGETFKRACDGMFVECHVRALVVHPDDDRVLYLGCELGLFRSEDGADSWNRIDSPASGQQVWSILFGTSPPHPRPLSPGGARGGNGPGTLLVGVCPSRLYLSNDAGKTWTEPAARILQACPRILHTRVTTLLADPRNPQTMWAGVEIDGLQRTRDGGRTWHPVGKGLSSQDIHALAILPSKLIATTNNDVNVSTDEGDTWTPLRLGEKLPLPYFRGLAQHAERPDILFLGNGDAPPGTTGLIARSLDGGVTWQPASMPARANSTIWNFAVHPSDPNLIYASSVSGQAYRSNDAGATWHKLAREFGEIRALAWTP
jgi:photosystem II stability/assembly factor-like uncharacterized protein